MAKVRKVSLTFKKLALVNLRRKIAWQTGAGVETRTQNARLVYWQIFKRVDPKYTAGVMLALLLQGRRNNLKLNWDTTQLVADCGLYTLGGLSTMATGIFKGLENSAAAEKLRNMYAGESLDPYAEHLHCFDIDQKYSYAYSRALRFGLAAAKFASAVEWPENERNSLIRWFTMYGAYTSLNWHPSKSKAAESVQKQDQLLLQLHREIRKLLPLTFNHVVMAMAYMSRKK